MPKLDDNNAAAMKVIASGPRNLCATSVATDEVVGTLAMSGAQLAQYVTAWLIVFVLVGFAEEMDFRAAGLMTLAGAIGFWPAAIVTSLVFSAAHYFFKPMENIADALNIGLLALFLCFTILRTGAIWFAVGFHALTG